MAVVWHTFCDLYNFVLSFIALFEYHSKHNLYWPLQQRSADLLVK